MMHDRHHVRLLQNAHADWIEAQYRGMQAMPGNPQQVVIRTIGPTRTFIAAGQRLENRAMRDGFASGCTRAFTVTDLNFSSPANLQWCGFSLAYNYLLVRREPSASVT